MLPHSLREKASHAVSALYRSSTKPGIDPGTELSKVHQRRFKPMLSSLFYFYQNSAVRYAGLVEIQSILDEPQLKLVNAKDVRWLSHDNACRVLKSTLPAVLASLEREVAEPGNVLAAGLSSQCQKYQFVATLYLMCRVLPPISAFSRLLQSNELDLTLLQPGPISANTSLRHLRGKNDIVDLVEAADLAIGGRLHSTCILVQPNSREAFKRNIQGPFLQALMENMESRLAGTEILAAFTIFDPSKLPDNLQELNGHGDDHLQTLIDQFGTGENGLVEGEAAQEERQRFVFLMSDTQRAKTIQDVLRLLAGSPGMAALYPNLSRLASIALLLPLSTAEGERVFSGLKRVKTILRNRMKESTLENILRIQREGPPLEEFDFNKAIEVWGSKKKRRITVPQPQ